MRDYPLPGALLFPHRGLLDHRAPEEHALREGGEVEDRRAEAVEVAPNDGSGPAV
jgi:hypothetical protein